MNGVMPIPPATSSSGRAVSFGSTKSPPTEVADTISPGSRRSSALLKLLERSAVLSPNRRLGLVRVPMRC